MGRTPSNSDDIIDLRDLRQRLEELEEMTEERPIEGSEDEDDPETETVSIRDEDEEAEMISLKSFLDDIDGRCDGPLIRDDYFEEYAQQLADDIGAVDRDVGWPLTCIDWEQAANELQSDYSSAEWDGVTYWYQS